MFRKTLLVLFLITFTVPLSVSAHTESTGVSRNSGFVMMQQIEDRALGDKLHEEMEGLMVNMMSGNLTEIQANRVSELINQYPGMGALMLSRLMGMGALGSEFNGLNQNNMMEYGLVGLGGGFMMLLFWILVIIGIVALVRYIFRNNAKSGSSGSALDILKERYAKGEIEKDEFEEKKKGLQQ